MRLGLGRKQFAFGLTFVVFSLSHVTVHLSKINFSSRSWIRKKLGVKLLQLRIEDFARRKDLFQAVMRAPALSGAYATRASVVLYSDAITHQSPSPTAFLSLLEPHWRTYISRN